MVGNMQVRMIFIILGLSMANHAHSVVSAHAGEDEFELVSLPDPTAQVENLYPMDMSSMLTGTQVREIIQTGRSSLDDKKLMTMVDTDRASGTLLTANGQHRFLFSFKTISRFHEIVITGTLKGATVSVDLAEMPVLPNKEGWPRSEQGWQRVINDKPLAPPATSLLFRPQSVFLAVVMLKTAAAEVEPHPTICDVAFYSTKDVREFELVPSEVGLASNSTSGQENPSANSSSNLAVSVQADDLEKEKAWESQAQDKGDHETQYNLGGMQAGAQITQVSSLANLEQADMAHDDSAATYMEFDPGEKESVTVLDLGTARRLQKFSLVHSSRAGDLKLYSTNRLPWGAHNEPPHQTARHAVSVASLAWLDVSILPGRAPVDSDVPLFAQFSRPPPQKTTHTLRIRSSLFDQLAQFGSVSAENRYFTQLTGPVVSHRFVVLRFISRSTDASEGFRIHDWNVFGNYRPGDFRLVPKTLPQNQEEPLVVLDPPMPVAGIREPDYSGIGHVALPPPPVSPSSP